MATTLDASWFSTHVGPPWVLTSGVYNLAVDVDVPSVLSSGVPNSGVSYGGGELFKLAATGVELNLNGHYVRINGRDIKQATRGGPRVDSNFSEFEAPVQTIDPLGNNQEWEKPQDSGGRSPSDTGGHQPNTESNTGVTPSQPRGGETSTGRGR